jgi:FAD/FMN-containing dehydrogenase
MEEWSNWSGSLRFSPGNFYEPPDEKLLTEIIEQAVNEKRKIRVAGAGHSSSPLVVTDNTLISLKHFREVGETDLKNNTAWVGTGLTVREAGKMLLDKNLSLHNTGDVDVQYLAGAISTGTHGTGIKLQNLSSMLIGCRIVCFDGTIREFTEEKDGKDFFDALRVSLGSFGIITGMKLKLLPPFKLKRKEWCTTVDRCLGNLDELVHENRNFDFYWYPRNDLVKLRTLNEHDTHTNIPEFADIVKYETGWAIDVLPRERDLKFDEMEFAMPYEAGIPCFNEIRKIVKTHFRKTVAWRILYRTIKADDFFLSPSFGRDTVTISLHHNAGLSFTEYFDAIEPVFRHYSGRPHWGKKHSVKSEELSTMYPRWTDFLEIRKMMDPERLFLNDYLEKQIFGL